MGARSEKERTVYSDETGKVCTELSLLKWASEDAQAPRRKKIANEKTGSHKKKNTVCFTLKRRKYVQVVDVWLEALGQVGMVAAWHAKELLQPQM